MSGSNSISMKVVSRMTLRATMSMLQMTELIGRPSRLSCLFEVMEQTESSPFRDAKVCEMSRFHQASKTSALRPIRCGWVWTSPTMTSFSSSILSQCSSSWRTSFAHTSSWRCVGIQFSVMSLRNTWTCRHRCVRGDARIFSTFMHSMAERSMNTV